MVHQLLSSSRITHHLPNSELARLPTGMVKVVL